MPRANNGSIRGHFGVEKGLHTERSGGRRGARWPPSARPAFSSTTTLNGQKEAGDEVMPTARNPEKPLPINVYV